MSSISKNNSNAKAQRASGSYHLIRPRINTLLDSKTSNRVVTVCAGAGCGKTRAVLDFLQQQNKQFFRLHFSEHDNTPEHLWESIIDSTAPIFPELVESLRQLGFPDTGEKIERFLDLRRSALRGKPYIIVCDDVHFLTEPSALALMGRLISGLTPNLTMILIYRNFPDIDIKSIQMKGLVSEVNEGDLNFTENELASYLKQQGLFIDSQTIREIYKDTRGWTFAINLVARSLSRVPKYTGFVKATLRPNIFEFMESENWVELSERLKCFLVQLSLIDHLSAELINILADSDEGLLSELKSRNAYIHFDHFGGAYLIHHLYLDFLKSKQEILKDSDKHKTYKAAADWCNRNNFKTDALNYYEKIGDYESIVSVLFELPVLIPLDIAQYAKGIFERAPAETFSTVNYFAMFHVSVIIRLGYEEEFFSLTEFYEKQFLALPKDSMMRKTSLSGIYFCLGMNRAACTYDGDYDFDVYFSKMFDCFTQEHFDSLPPLDYPRGAWLNLTYSSEKGAPQRYIDAVIRSDITTARFSDGISVGADLLVQGELLFCQGSLKAAEALILRSTENSTKRMAYDTLHRALFYLMRIAVSDGNMKKFEKVFQNIENLLDERAYFQRFVTHDISSGWFQFVLRQPKMFPGWLCEEFSEYTNAAVIENFGNQIKARYHYLTRNYLPLLSYISEMKQRKSILYGRIEMLAIEACVHYQMKNKTKAWASLKEAYNEASPNKIIMPFIELGKDMRTLIMAFLREADPAIPRSWLELIRSKSASYAKNQSMFITNHKLSETAADRVLSAREYDVLSDLYYGLSQSEIAEKRSIAINTVKMVTKSIYDKLHVHKISDLIRVAAEQRLV